MEGLKRLLKNGRFTGAESARVIQEQYERGADTVKAFFEEWTEDGEFITKGELWEAFRKYCKKYNVPLAYSSKRDFGDRIKKSHIEGQKTINGKNCRVWLGIKLQSHVSHGSNVFLPKLRRSKSVENKGGKRKKRVKRIALEEFK